MLVLVGLASPVRAGNGEGDPLEPANRVTFAFNQKVEAYVARPVANAYRHLPRLLRDGIRGTLDNMDSPLVCVNQMLQGDSGAATRTAGRFFLNTVFGVAGFFDVASEVGIPGRDADLGQTLGVWGVGDDPYLVVPILGPSNPRDFLASVAQGNGDPLNAWVQNETDYGWIPFVYRFLIGSIDRYSRRMDDLQRIREASVDYYAALRSYYRQNRRQEIRKVRSPDEPVVPDLEYDVELE